MIFTPVDDRTSFESMTRWISECHTINENAPIMWVVTKVDLRKENPLSVNMVSKEEIEKEFFRLGLQSLQETSVRTDDFSSAKDVFKRAVAMVNQHQKL